MEDGSGAGSQGADSSPQLTPDVHPAATEQPPAKPDETSPASESNPSAVVNSHVSASASNSL